MSLQFEYPARFHPPCAQQFHHQPKTSKGKNYMAEKVVIVGTAYSPSEAPPEVGGGPILPPPGIWPSPGHPAHPIAPGTPPGIWGGAPPLVTPPIWLPGHPSTGPIYPVGPVDPGYGIGIGHPAHPIYPVIPVDPDYDIPTFPPKPPGVWLPIYYPPEINNGLPSPPLLGFLPVDPGWGVPLPPQVSNPIPPGVWLPIHIPGECHCGGGGGAHVEPPIWVFVPEPKLTQPKAKGKK